MTRHFLEARHQEHFRKLGIKDIPEHVDMHDAEYEEHYAAWKRTLPKAPHHVLHMKTLGHGAWIRHCAVQPAVKKEKRAHELRWVIGLLAAILVLLVFHPKAHAQFSYPIQTKNGGTGIGFHKSFFVINCSTNTTCTDDGTTLTVTASSTAGTAWDSLTPPTAGGLTFQMFANGDGLLTVKRKTDTSPTGSFFDFQNSAAASLCKLDILGNLTCQAIRAVDGSTSAAGLSFSGQTNTGFYRPASAQIGIVGNGSRIGEFMAIAGLALTNGLVYGWNAADNNALDAAISRLGAASFAFGNGTAGDFSATLKAATYNATSGYQVGGVPLACGNLSDSAGGCTMSTTAAGDISGTLPNVNVVSTHLAAALPEAQGGLGTTAIGTNGQVPICDGSGHCVPGDPIVSYNYLNLWTAQDVTTTRTSAAVRVSTFGARGSLFITWASITGSPSGCTIQLKSGDSLGNFVNNGSAISVSPANGTTQLLFAPATATPTQAQAEAVFACGTTYPTTGTLTLELAPSISVDANIATIAGTAPTTPGKLDAKSADGDLATIGAKADAKASQTDTTAISVIQILKELSFLLQNKLLVTPDSVALPANQSVNEAQINGVAPLMGNGGTGTGSQRVTIASDNTAFAVNATLQANSGVDIGKLTANQSVNLSQIAGSTAVADPCQVNTKVYGSFSGTASAQLIAGTSAKKIYFCSFSVLAGGVNNVAIVEGTGSVCATGIATFPALSGGTTAATGWNFAANGGIAQGNGGAALAGEATNADNVCALLSAAVQTNINYSYVVQ